MYTLRKEGDGRAMRGRGEEEGQVPIGGRREMWVVLYIILKQVLHEHILTDVVAMESSRSSLPPNAHHQSLSPVQHQHQAHISPTFTQQQTFVSNPPVPPSYSHDQQQQQPQQQPMSNLPPSLQPNAGQRQTGLPDDIWLAPPLDGDNGIGLSGVGDGRMWFGSGGLTMADNTGGTSTRESKTTSWALATC